MEENNIKLNRITKTILYIVMALSTLILVFPFLWMVMLSFKTNSQILTEPFKLPQVLSFENYARAIKTLDIFTLYKNTAIVVLLTMVIELVITFSSSFALSRMVFKSRRVQSAIYSFLLAGLAIPAFILLFPVYKITIGLKLYGSLFSLVLPYIATSISFNTLIFTGFLNGLPREIDEAAIIDGCGLFRLCVSVIVPIIKPVIMTVVIFNVLYIWNEFPFAVTLINDASKYTISLGTSFFKGRWNVDYSGIIAASVLVIVPQLLFYGFFQKYIISGMTAGAVKG
jgi:raffinose/stachyose/melibiose transport system permease protein